MSALRNWQLFAICVLTWGTTWYAITWQIDALSPEASVAWRFTIAAAVVLGGCAARGDRLRLPARLQALLALQGTLLYGFAYVAVYHAERHVPSGLVAVGYSASPLVAGIGARLLFGAPLGGRFLLGGLAGAAGVALIFRTQFERAGTADDVTLGALYTALAVLVSGAGGLAASRNRQHGLPFWPALGFGIGWGAAASWIVVALRGVPAVPPASPAWWAALLYLSLAGSVLTFACYLTLLDRIGPGRASTIGVMTPLLALLVSIALEGYRPDGWTFAGAALAVAGNVLMLRESRRA